LRLFWFGLFWPSNYWAMILLHDFVFDLSVFSEILSFRSFLYLIKASAIARSE